MSDMDEHKHEYGSSGQCACGMHRDGASATGMIEEEADRLRRRRILNELTQMSQEMGLYDDEFKK